MLASTEISESQSSTVRTSTEKLRYSQPSTRRTGDFHIDDSNSFAPEILEHGTIAHRLTTCILGLYCFEKSRIFIKYSLSIIGLSEDLW